MSRGCCAESASVEFKRNTRQRGLTSVTTVLSYDANRFWQTGAKCERHFHGGGERPPSGRPAGAAADSARRSRSVRAAVSARSICRTVMYGRSGRISRKDIKRCDGTQFQHAIATLTACRVPLAPAITRTHMTRRREIGERQIQRERERERGRETRSKNISPGLLGGAMSHKQTDRPRRRRAGGHIACTRSIV